MTSQGIPSALRAAQLSWTLSRQRISLQRPCLDRQARLIEKILLMLMHACLLPLKVKKISDGAKAKFDGKGGC